VPELKHARVVTRTPQPDGTVEILHESYYEKLNSIEVETQQSIKTSKATFPVDLMRCMEPITQHKSRQVIIQVETNERYEPIRIVKTWVIRKEYYGR